MKAQNIARFVHLFLETHNTITAQELQDFIFSREEVGLKLPMITLENILDDMFFSKELDISFNEKDVSIYKEHEA